MQFNDGVYLGEIRMFAGSFAPIGWAFCDGTILSVSQNQALYAIIGNTYGGVADKTFALPNLRGRLPLAAGTGHGLTERHIGDADGIEFATLVEEHLPAHRHKLSGVSGEIVSKIPIQVTLPISTSLGDKDTPGSGNILAKSPVADVLDAFNNANLGVSSIDTANFKSNIYHTNDNTGNIPCNVVNGSGPYDISNLKLEEEPVGKNLAHINMPPFLCINFIIALAGEFPMRP